MSGSVNDQLVTLLNQLVDGSGTLAGALPTAASIPAATQVTSVTDTATAPVTPGALGSISATTSLPAGTYEVEVKSMINGTFADADLANMRLVADGGSTAVTRILNPGGAIVTTTKARVKTNGGTLGVIAIAAATAGSKYWAQIIATRIA